MPRSALDHARLEVSVMHSASTLSRLRKSSIDHALRRRGRRLSQQQDWCASRFAAKCWRPTSCRWTDQVLWIDWCPTL